MKLEVGKYYKTRDGRKARVTVVDNDLTADIETDDGFVGVVFIENGMADVYPGFVHGSETSYDIIEEWKEEHICSSPIQEKTVKELVPGVYGCVTVGAGYTGELRYSVSPFMNVDQLRAAAKTFNEIADYLEEND